MCTMGPGVVMLRYIRKRKMSDCQIIFWKNLGSVYLINYASEIKLFLMSVTGRHHNPLKLEKVLNFTIGSGVVVFRMGRMGVVRSESQISKRTELFDIGVWCAFIRRTK